MYPGEAARVRGRAGRRTDLDAGDAEAASLEDDADAAGGDALAEPADDAARDQHVLGGRGRRLLSRRRGHEAGGGGEGASIPWGKKRTLAPCAKLYLFGSGPDLSGPGFSICWAWIWALGLHLCLDRAGAIE